MWNSCRDCCAGQSLTDLIMADSPFCMYDGHWLALFSYLGASWVQISQKLISFGDTRTHKRNNNANYNSVLLQ
jgi:hypothetical protein